MRDHETLRRRRLAEELAPTTAGSRMMLKPILGVALAVGLMLSAAPAMAGKRLDSRPVRFWSVLRMDQVGERKVAGDIQRGGLLKKTVDIGPAAFILEPILAPARAIADVLSTADGKDYHVLAQAPVKDPDDPHSAIGSVVHLDEYQTYKKRARDASLSITISRLVLQAVDNNGVFTDAECPERPCSPIIATVQFHAGPTKETLASSSASPARPTSWAPTEDGSLRSRTSTPACRTPGTGCGATISRSKARSSGMGLRSRCG